MTPQQEDWLANPSVP